jgi:hypothetical protein
MASSTQVAVFALMYLTYVVYYFMRCNYSVWLKALVQEEGFTTSEGGGALALRSPTRLRAPPPHASAHTPARSPPAVA